MTDSRRSVRALGGIAFGLGVLAVFAGAPSRSTSRLDVVSLARAVEHEDDHITAVELAKWIRDRRTGLRIVDIRDPADFDAYHIPEAERIDLDRLVSMSFKRSETIVLYSGGGAHAAQGWVFLRALGFTKVYFLRGGLGEWMTEVINPVFPSNASAGERLEMDSVAAISRYFGGQPRMSDSTAAVEPGIAQSSSESGSWKAAVARVRGRGC